MSAFERLVAGRTQHHAGPIRPVDDAAIFATVAAARSPSWSLGAMFGATRFVVAGAIVALFGGFLLAGFLSQPSEEPAPAIAASAPATTQAEPTEVATREPAPTAEAEADDTTTTPVLLPGVDLVTEEVAPGMYRVLNDGERGLRQNVRDVAVTSDGTVFVEKHGSGGPCFEFDAKNSRVYGLGEAGVAMADAKWDLKARYLEWGLSPRREEVRDCEPRVGPGLRFGTIRGHGAVLWRDVDNGQSFDQGDAAAHVYDGQRWIAVTDPAVIDCARHAEWDPSSTLIDDDGACWTRPDSPTREASGSVLAERVDAVGERTIITPEDVGTGGGLAPARFAIGPAGQVWTGLHATTGGNGPISFEGLASFDGEAWTHIPYTPAGASKLSDARLVDLVVTPDGVAWAAVGDWEKIAIVSWDGIAWVDHGVFDPAGQRPRRSVPHLSVAPDGSVWLDGRHRFDGTTVETIDLPVTGDNYVVALAPDGSMWIADSGLYVITPEALATAE